MFEIKVLKLAKSNKPMFEFHNCAFELIMIILKLPKSLENNLEGTQKKM